MFSPVKLIILILAALGVWAGYKWVSGLRDGDGSGGGKVGRRKKDNVGKGGNPDAVQDLVKCPKCGAYVASLDNHACSG